MDQSCDQSCDRISALLESNDPYKNEGALRVIDELIDVALSENASMVSRFSDYLRMVFEVKHDERTLVLAGNVLGHLARAGGVMMTDEMERQVGHFSNSSLYAFFNIVTWCSLFL